MACNNMDNNSSMDVVPGLHGFVPVLVDDVTDIDVNCTAEYREFYNMAQFITGLILYPIICITGVIGSIFTLVVFNQKMLRTSTSVFLSALAVADLIRLLNDTLYFVFSVLRRTTPASAMVMMGYMYPVSHYILNQSVCVASWLHVCIGFERYVHVCKATKVKELCTVGRAKIISLTVFVIMSLVTIPSALRYETTTEFQPDNCNQTIYAIKFTKLGRSEFFTLYYTWTVNLLHSLLPICILIILNSCIIHSLRRQKVRGKISASNRITLMLVVVIVVFVVCITPNAIMNTAFGYSYIDSTCLVKGVREFTDTLLALNSAVNFPIYCLCSHTFRRTYKMVFLGGGPPSTNMFKMTHISKKPLLQGFRKPTEVIPFNKTSSC